MTDQILSLLGLCKKGGMLVIGEEPVEAVARARDARVLLLAEDAADNTLRRVRHFAEAGDCLWLRLPYTKEELGRALGLPRRLLPSAPPSVSPRPAGPASPAGPFFSFSLIFIYCFGHTARPVGS